MTEEQYHDIQSYYDRLMNAERNLKTLTELRNDAKKDYERTKDIYCLTEVIFHNPSIFADALPKFFFDHMDKMIHKAEEEYNYQKTVFEDL